MVTDSVAPMSAMPTGTVTLLFTDIEGSTRLWERHPDAMVIALARHDSLMRSAIESHGGYVFTTLGDAFCAAFAAARDAVAAAVRAQQILSAEPWPDPLELKVRMALHTGECEERDGDYFGPAVNRAARLETLGYGGQVLASRSTAELVRDRLPSGVRLDNLGSHHLRDLDRPEEVYQLLIEGVPHLFPPLRASSEHDAEVGADNPTNLDEPVSSLIGRESVVTHVMSLLDDHRTVTLTGSGGVGKTRLAIEVGRGVLGDTADGVWLVELASVSDPALVAGQVMRDLGIGNRNGKDAVGALTGLLATQKRLLILDNCEHLLDSCAALAETLLRTCPGIRLLATSREPLRVEGEVLYRVPSLSLPPESVDDAGDLLESGAAALFLERARAQAPDFVVDGDASLIASICRRLDGVPLALELAAARLRSMSVAQLNDRLEHRFDVLTSGRRAALPRQQTLAATVDWSFDLLSEQEKALFRRVSVFVDGFELEAAESVCASADVAPATVAEHLASLVDKSLVAVEQHGGHYRYRLQETLHQYAAERLDDVTPSDGAPSESSVMSDAHATCYLTMADASESQLRGRSFFEQMKRLDREDSNLRAAIEHALATRRGVDLVVRQFWSAQRYWRESRLPARALSLLDQALEEAGSDVSVVDRARAQFVRSKLLFNVDGRLQIDAASAALDLARAAGDKTLEAEVMAQLGRSLAENGRGAEALVTCAAAVELARARQDPLLLGTVLGHFGSTAILTGDPRAEEVFLEALALTETTGDAYAATSINTNFSLRLIDESRFADARRRLVTALELNNFELWSSTLYAYNDLAFATLVEGDPLQASQLSTAVLRYCRLNGLLTLTPYVVLNLASCAGRLGRWDLGATLHGGAQVLLSATSDDWELQAATYRDKSIAELRSSLGDNFDTRFADGLAMAPDDVIRLALTLAPSQGSLLSSFKDRLASQRQ